MATFRDLLRDARLRITETDPVGAEALLADGYLLLDVREPDEFEQGAVPGSVHTVSYTHLTLPTKRIV